MQRFIIGIAMLMFFIACGEKVPNGIIPRKQMPDVLYDVHLADGQLTSMPIDSARAYLDSYYNAIFERYGIDSVALRQSIEYYMGRPKVMNEVYEVVEKRLEAMNAAEQAEVEEKYRLQRVADSIRNAHVRDSTDRINRDSLHFKRLRHLLFLHEADSTYDKPDSVTYEKLRERLFENIRFDQVYVDRLQTRIHTDTISDSTATVPLPERVPTKPIRMSRPLDTGRREIQQY